jgi:UDP-N-acetylmuramyl pentapeptide phosphotransferase/UDP-N-acetylglucosamine-1-phosphate transferase
VLSAALLDELRDHLEVVWGAALALALVLVLTPAVGRFGRFLGVVDRPEARRINTRVIPRLGGLALFFGILVPGLAFLDLGRETRGRLLGAAVATLVGAIDDFRGLAWWEKLGGQLAAAAIPTGFGIWVDRFTFPVVGIHELPGWAGVPLTILWIVAIMNMINFLDGLDGLAAGVCAIAGATFSVIALSLGKPNAAVVSAIVFGAALGFRHLHHRFVAHGFSQRRSVLYIYVWVASLAAAALATRFIPFREHGHWHLWPTVAAGAIGAAAVAASVYMVYLLEIVKLTSPRARREQAKSQASARKTA